MKGVKKNFIKTGVFMALAALVIIIGALYYMNIVNRSLKQTTGQYLTEIAWQSANMVKKQVEGDFQMLQAVAGLIGGQKEFRITPNMKILAKVAQNTTFKRMGLILPNGMAYTTDHINMMLADREFFQKGMNGESTVSEALVDKTDGGKIYAYETPVYHDGQVVAVLFATSRARTYSNLLDIKLFGDDAYSVITNRGGEVIIHSKHPDNYLDIQNVFEKDILKIETSSIELSKMQYDMKNSQSGIIGYTRNGKFGYISYIWLDVNDWYVISVIPTNVVVDKFTNLSGMILAACGMTVVIFFGLFSYIMLAQGRYKQELERLAYTDEVTGGYNWNRFRMASQAVLNQSGNQQYAMVIFDIDKFKVLNDLFGHAEGNQIIQYIWCILRENFEAEEPFAHIAADNFNILMWYKDDDEIKRRLSGISEQVERYREVSSSGYSIKLSFGVYQIAEKTLSVNRMSDRANIARKTIKGNHERMIAFYDQEVRERIIAEKNIENEMADALKNGEFEVYLQPKYSLSTRKIVGAEALVRWNHPKRGIISPGEFIPIFEKNGFVVNIDRFVLEKICAKQREWIGQGLDTVPVSVNISRVNLHNPDFPQNTTEIVQKYEIPCDLIELELTESAMLDFKNSAKLIDMINMLKAEGFVIAMDDFGTGYSSLNMLWQLPVDVLKLDREFFGTDTGTSRGQTVISDVVAMANHLDIKVVAEGVEEKEQIDFLSTIGCDIVQGYYFAKPMPVAGYEKLYADKKK